MIERIRLDGKKLYRCGTCKALFNELELGESHGNPCPTIRKISNKFTFNQSESERLRATLEKPLKRSYNLQVPIKRIGRVNG